MHKVHVFLIAGALAAAAVLGTTAALRTTSLGRAHRAAGDAAVTARAKQLDRFEAALRRRLAKRPPALPAVPKAAPAAPAAAAPRVVYRRPPAIVVVKHTHHGDDGGLEHADGGGGGDD
jgi:hypothetical protein